MKFKHIEVILDSARSQRLAESCEWGSKARKNDAKSKKRFRSKIRYYLKVHMV